MTQEVQQGEPVRIASKAPERPNANSAAYTCLFGFRQFIQHDMGNNDTVEIARPSTMEIDYYFMAGTNTEGTPIFFEPGTQLEKSESQLDAYASKTENMTYINPFTNFPYETVTGSGEGRRWHPVKYHCNVAYPDTC